MWKRLLEGTVRAQALGLARAIGEATARRSLDSVEDPGLLAGHAGYAVFFSELATAFEAGYEEYAEDCLERAIDWLSAGGTQPQFHRGFTGIAWALHRYRGDGEDLEEVDQLLAAFVSRRPWSAAYDLRSGLIGFGVYALERLPAPHARTCLASIVQRLEELATCEGDELAWMTERRHWPGASLPPTRAFLPGVAHGFGSALPLLGACAARGIEPERARRLLAGAFQWLRAKARGPEAACRFDLVFDGERWSNFGQSAWCNGDAGIARAMWMGARALGAAEWQQEAMALGLSVAESLSQRLPQELNLCCGTAGLGHLFNRWYQETDSAAFRQAALRCFEDVLARCEPPEEDCEALDGPLSLQFGTAGIALALLAACQEGEEEPLWDRPFLFSVPTP